MKTEIQLRKTTLSGELVETIYFGGGTPSLLSVIELEALLTEIRQHYSVSATPEITLEVNPDDVVFENGTSVELFKAYKAIGINRLSIGVQSFFAEDLKAMNRAHNAHEAHACLAEASKHFENISIDLIYGIPNMSLERWQKNLQTAFDAGVSHISSYALTVEPKTALASFIKKGSYPALSDALAASHFDALVSATEQHGFVQYEISNFGKPGYFSKHNTSYWLGKKYIGFGPSAHSYNKTHRSWNIANNTRYIKSLEKGLLPSENEALTKNDRLNEYIMTGLRTVWGVSFQKIQEEFGDVIAENLKKSAQKFITEGLLCVAENTLKTTSKGKFLADGLASELFVVTPL